MSELNLADRILGEYFEKEPEEGVKQLSRLLDMREVEQMKLSLTLQKKDMEIVVLQKALEGEQKTGKHLIECLNKMQERWDELSAFCDKIMKESREKNDKINELRSQVGLMTEELEAFKSEEEYRLKQLT
jgi:HAMP domain-containing protein